MIHRNQIQTAVIEMAKQDVEKRQIVVTLFAIDFERSLGRKPADQAEFDRWVKKANLALFNGCLDWDRLYENAAFQYTCGKKEVKNEC